MLVMVEGYSRHALANLFKNSGCDVTKEYYVNDAGRQISILSASVLLNAFCSKFESEVRMRENI